MANMNDSQIVSALVALPEQKRFIAFRRFSDEIKDDATYWNVLGSLWKDVGEVQQQSLWLPLFRSSRRSRHKIMTSSERKEFARLPEMVTAYRAINGESEISTAISWTLSPEIAQRVFSHNGKRQVVKRQFNKKQILAYFSRRNEQEIIVIPNLK
ncbi:TPA: hypothetical protein ACPJ18_004137 [Vibrio alginolyticus]